VASLGGSSGRRALPRRRLHRDATRRAARAALGGRRPRRPPRDRPPRRPAANVEGPNEELAGASPCRLPTQRPAHSPGWPTVATTTARNDYVFCSRLGRRLDPSAVRRRYKKRRDAAGLRPLRFHALRHAAGSLVAREAGGAFRAGIPRSLQAEHDRALPAREVAAARRRGLEPSIRRSRRRKQSRSPTDGPQPEGGAESCSRRTAWKMTRGGKHVVKMTKPGERPITLPAPTRTANYPPG